MSSKRLWASIGYTGTRITTFPTILQCHAHSHVSDGTISLGSALISCLFFRNYAGRLGTGLLGAGLLGAGLLGAGLFCAGLLDKSLSVQKVALPFTLPYTP